MAYLQVFGRVGRGEQVLAFFFFLSHRFSVRPIRGQGSLFHQNTPGRTGFWRHFIKVWRNCLLTWTPKIIKQTVFSHLIFKETSIKYGLTLMCCAQKSTNCKIPILKLEEIVKKFSIKVATMSR